MPVELSCQACMSVLRVPDFAQGRRVWCPKCRAVVRVPAADGAVVVEAVKERIAERPSAPAAPARTESRQVERSALRHRIRDKAPATHEVVEEVEVVEDLD